MIISKLIHYFSNVTLKDKILIKTHKNFYKLYFYKKENFFRKISNNNIGSHRILADRNGLKWYCKLTKKNTKSIIKKFFKKKKYTFLDTFKIDGVQIKSWNSLEKNYSFLIKVLNHYIKYFPKKKKTRIHGDLTFDNIFFKKNKIFIIDWEFFESKKNYYGYDLAYLILSSLCIPYIAKKKISSKDEKLFLIFWKKLLRKNINREIIYNPFSFFEKNIKKDRFLKVNFNLSKFKFFPFLVNLKYKKRINQLIKNNI